MLSPVLDPAKWMGACVRFKAEMFNQLGELREMPGSAGGLEDSAATPSEWVHLKLGFEPDEMQRRLLDLDGKRVILNCSRQWGKSTVTAAKAVHHACTNEDSMVLVVSPCLRQSGEFMTKAERFARMLGSPVRGDGKHRLSIRFENRSRLVGLPGTEATIRGFSKVSLLLIDEAARVEDELYLAMRPVLAVSGGALWLMSTPYGKRGFFWEEWTKGGHEWERVKVRATECPRIKPEFLEEERRRGERHFRQEYQCEFTDAAQYVFDREMVERCIRQDLEPLRFDK
jgi:hypothetical protein